MIVRRVSYFTFIVAITTIATVSSCNRAKAQAQQALLYGENLASQSSSTVTDDRYTHTGTTIDCTLALAKALEEKGLKAGKFKITTDASGHQNVVSVYLIFSKDYKGQVSAKIFDSKNGEHDTIAAMAALFSAKALYAEHTCDRRNAIKRKNRILLE